MAEEDLISLERRLLGSLLVDNRRLLKLIRTRTVLAEHFTDRINRVIWLAMTELSAKGQIANPVTVKDYVFKFQSDNHYEKIDPKYLAKLAYEAANSFDQFNELIQKWRAAHPDWWEWYNAYLNTDAWRSRRSKVIERCGGICEGCRETAVTQVHHLTYDHVGDEFLFELVGLCNVCHSRIHEWTLEPPQ